MTPDLAREMVDLTIEHLVLVAVLLVLMAVRVYEWQRVGLVSQMLASSSFYYWSVLHIATSLWRK